MLATSANEVLREGARSLRHVLRRNLKSARLRLHRLTVDDIRRSLVNLGATTPELLFVHSSLSGCGHIVGGPATVVGALQEWLQGGGLAMPTHTYCYPDEHNEREVFDRAATESKVGAITNHFWREPGVSRSLHPTHSLAVRGPASEELIALHETCDTPCGRGTPYERLVQRDAAVLMFGATMNTYTLFHTAEDAANVPYLYEQVPLDLLVKADDGSIRTVRMRRQDMSVPRRFEEMAEWLEERGALVRRRLGIGELLFIPSSARVHELVVDEMRKDPWFLAIREEGNAR